MHSKIVIYHVYIQYRGPAGDVLYRKYGGLL